MTQKRVAILGGGLSGLSIAYFLHKEGLHADVFEQSCRIGGVIKSVATEDFLYECGPNTGVASNIETELLLSDLSSNCTPIFAHEHAKKRLIWKQNNWHALPNSLGSFIKTPLFSSYDKFRILGEPFRKRGTDPLENLKNLTIRRLGESFHDYAVAPFINGIYAGNSEEIIPKYALPKLYELEQTYGSFIQGAFAKHAQINKGTKHTHHKKPIFSCEGGLEELITALAEPIGANIYTNCSGLQVTKTAEGYSITYTHAHTQEKTHAEYDILVSTIPSYAYASVFPFIAEKELSIISAIPYAPVVQISCGYKKWDGMPLNAFGGLCPPKESRNILGVLFTSEMFSGRAPEEGALLSVFLGGMLQQEYASKSKEELIEIALGEIQELLQCSSPEPDLIAVNTYRHAIAQYTKHHMQVYASKERIEQEHKNIYIGGGFVNGISIADRIAQAKNIAHKIFL